MSEQLTPCPFCGDAEHLLREHLEGTVLHPAYRILCDNCGASSGFTDKDAAAGWNRRADNDRLRAENERHMLDADALVLTNAAQAKRIAELEALLRDVPPLDYETEYAGQMLSLCNGCQKNWDEDHKPDCLNRRIDAALSGREG